MRLFCRRWPVKMQENDLVIKIVLIKKLTIACNYAILNKLKEAEAPASHLMAPRMLLMG